MKLLKKLLPLATLASTAAVVAPMVTSCANNGVDLSKEYTPSIKQHDAYEADDAASGIKKYFELAAKNSQIIIQDFYWSYTKISTQLKLKGTLKISDVKIDTTKGLLSLNFYAKGTLEGSSITNESSLTISNIPYKGAYFQTNWLLGFDSDNSATGKWTADSKVKGYTTNGEGKKTSTREIVRGTIITSTDYELQAVYSLFAGLDWASYYFAKVTVKA